MTAIKPRTLAAFAMISLLASAPTGFAAESTSLPKASLEFGPSGIDPIEVAPAMGDMSKDGTHGNYVRIPGKFTSPPHIHTEDYFAIVVSGTIANGLPDAKDIALEPGSYWSQRGNEKHVTKCLSDEPCTFFVVQPGKFDFIVN